VCEPEWFALNDVRDVDAVVRPAAESLLDLFAPFVAEHDADLGDACLPKVFDCVLENRFVADRDELFGPSMGDRSKPGPRSTGEENAFHRQ